MSTSDEGPLGQQLSYPDQYDPGQLHPIPRERGRRVLGLQDLPFQGEDIWNAYEISWLNTKGKPHVASGVFRVRATSPNLIESKSLKLYLNSLNQTRFDSLEAVRDVVERDLSACAGEAVLVNLYAPELWPDRLATVDSMGECIDHLDVAITDYLPAAELLDADISRIAEETLSSHLLRSRCPVTGQPDWGSLIIDYRGPAIDRPGLLKYIVSFRDNDEFHEQCVERIYCDLLSRCEPERLTVSARYLRRGGLDINPVRSNVETDFHNPRLFRQ